MSNGNKNCLARRYYDAQTATLIARESHRESLAIGIIKRPLP